MRLLNHTPASAPGRWEAVGFVLLLLIQQNAFVSIPMLLSGLSMGEMRGTENAYNSVAVGLTAVFVAWEIRRFGRLVGHTLRDNLPILFFAALVLLSTTWSIHPEISLRRALGYLLTVAIAALLPLRFGRNGCMKLLSASFMVSAIGSVLYAALLPQYGIMHVADLEGCWQGVFATKELLGSVMAVAILVELYNLFASRPTAWWRAALLLLYMALLLRSRSMTALTAAAIYLAGAAAYLLWSRYRWRGLVFTGLGAAFVLLAPLLFLLEPGTILHAMGKDPTFTGRVYLWTEVDKLIAERPMLGWGYRAMWQPGDLTTAAIDSMAGFEAPSAHNTYLEVALGLGWSGLLALGCLLVTALRRGIECCLKDSPRLGWFTLLFIAGSAASGITTESMGMNQVIDWLLFNTLLVSCGVSLRLSAA